MKNNEHTYINTDMIDKISILAQLSLTEEEKLLAGEDMVRMLDFFARLSDWDDGSIEMAGPAGSKGKAGTERTNAAKENILRRDEVTNAPDDGQLLVNAPLQKDGMFVVPLSISAGSGEEANDDAFTAENRDQSQVVPP